MRIAAALQLLTFFIIAPLLAIALAYAAWRGKPQNLPGTKGPFDFAQGRLFDSRRAAPKAARDARRS